MPGHGRKGSLAPTAAFVRSDGLASIGSICAFPEVDDYSAPVMGNTGAGVMPKDSATGVGKNSESN